LLYIVNKTPISCTINTGITGFFQSFFLPQIAQAAGLILTKLKQVTDCLLSAYQLMELAEDIWSRKWRLFISFTQAVRRSIK
jgi:hypothetical protein